MLDANKVGIKICSFRKKTGLSQEKLAEKLCISPQAISKWENGHSLPDTSLLPVLAQIFGCTIDDMIMPAYSFDAKIEADKTDSLEKQAEHIAEIVIKKIGEDNMKKNTVKEQEIFNGTERKKMLTEDIDDGYFKGNAVMNIVCGWDKDHAEGKIYYENMKSVLKTAASFHSVLWGNAFEKIGSEWRLQTKENLLAHISGMEKDFKKYRKNYKPGATWEHHTDNIEDYQLDYFDKSIEYLKEEYVKYIDARFDTGINITGINGELEPA